MQIVLVPEVTHLPNAFCSDQPPLKPAAGQVMGKTWSFILIRNQRLGWASYGKRMSNLGPFLQSARLIRRHLACAPNSHNPKVVSSNLTRVRTCNPSVCIEAHSMAIVLPRNETQSFKKIRYQALWGARLHPHTRHPVGRTLHVLGERTRNETQSFGEPGRKPYHALAFTRDAPSLGREPPH